MFAFGQVWIGSNRPWNHLTLDAAFTVLIRSQQYIGRMMVFAGAKPLEIILSRIFRSLSERRPCYLIFGKAYPSILEEYTCK
jgi:hypothetical protein